MAWATAGFGTGTISSTSAGPGGIPSVTITDTDAFTATSFTVISKRNVVTDVKGDIDVYWTRVSDDTATFAASRQLPAGTEIVFDYLTMNDGA